MDEILASLQWLLGADTAGLDIVQMGLRALVIYLVTLVLIRLGDKRLIGKSTAFDFILAIVVGSVVSRAINGSAPLVPTLGAAAVLVLVHWLFALIAFHSDWFGNVVKGHTRRLVRAGQIQWESMRRGQISRDDLLGAVRLRGVNGLEAVNDAYLERNGEISVIASERQPRILDITVADGIQTVRVLLEER